MEQSLYNWFLQKRSIGDPVTGPMLKEKALEFNALLNGPLNFKASNGFLDKFKKRHNIRCIRIHGEKLSADKNASDQFCQDFLRYVLEKQVSLDRIYNADETGLNWKISLVSREEHRAPGKKMSKERVTLMVCTNASGTHKLPLLLIGKSKRPRCFKNAHSLPITYMSQSNAWMDKDLMTKWYQEVFLPEIEKVHGPNAGQCILLLDNAPSHPSVEHLNAISERCKIKYLPPNVTSLIQPMDQGVIAKCKHIYKTNLLRIILAKDTFEEVKKQLKSFDLLQCCYLISNAWNQLTSSNIRNAWKNIFPMYENSESQCDTDSQLIHTLNKFQLKYNNITEDINLWLHSDDNDQGWQILNEEELVFPENKENESEMDTEENNDNTEDDNTNHMVSAEDAFDAFNIFICYYKNQIESCSTDWDYIFKFWNTILNNMLQNTLST